MQEIHEIDIGFFMYDKIIDFKINTFWFNINLEPGYRTERQK